MLSLILTALLSVNYTVDSKEAFLLTRESKVEAPVILVVTEFTEDTALEFTSNFQKAIDTGQPFVPILISSYGGSIYALMTMIDVIKASPVPVVTVCSGKCMSAGAILLAAGTDGYRYAAPHSTVLVHDAATMMEGKVKDIENQAAELSRLNTILFSLLAKQTHKPLDFFVKMLDKKSHIDWFMSAQEAQGYGIVNHVKMPHIKIKVSTKMTLE